MRPERRVPEDERGIAMVLALLVLLVVAAIATTMIAGMNVETKLTGFSLREAEARNNAEAGVGEATSHIKNGDIPDDGNPRRVCQIFLTPSGSVPVLGVDSLALPTSQPDGHWLSYSTVARDPTALTVTYKTDAARTTIYRYDKSRNPPVNTASGTPIYVINSAGRCGNTVQKIQTEVFTNPFDLNNNAAFSSNVDVKLVGNGTICGFDHAANTPSNYGDNGRIGATGCQPYETGPHPLPGVRTTASVNAGGASQQAGNPTGIAEHQSGFYAGPWEVIGLMQPDFYAMMGPPVTSPPSPVNGLVYLDNDNVTQNTSGSFGFHGTSGQGFLYIDGDATFNSTFTYRGLVYVEGDVTVNGQAWILGALIAKGKTTCKLNGGMTVLYSSEAVQLALTQACGRFVTLAWRQLP